MRRGISPTCRVVVQGAAAKCSDRQATAHRRQRPEAVDGRESVVPNDAEVSTNRRELVQPIEVDKIVLSDISTAAINPEGAAAADGQAAQEGPQPPPSFATTLAMSSVTIFRSFAASMFIAT